MAKGVESLIIGAALILAGFGYGFQLVTKDIDANLSLLFLLNILIIYILLKSVKFK
jgi:hypothetical protein